MNQILVENNNNNDDDDKVLDIKKVIIILSIAVIVVGAIIIGVSLSKNAKDNTTIQKNPIKPTIEIEQDGENVKVNVECEDGISSIKYIWNNNDETNIPLNGSKTYEKMLNIPEGEDNFLEILATSQTGAQTNEQRTFFRQVDNIKPVIESLTVVGSTLTVIVTDENEIDYVAYRWEEEEEITQKPVEDQKKKMTVEINALRGSHKLYLKVVDKAGNIKEESKIIKGVNQPEIEAIKYDNKVEIKVKHDMGFKRIEFVINNDIYIYDERFSGYDAFKKEIVYSFPLKNGKNEIIVNAYSLEKYDEEQIEDDLENYANRIFKGKCTYEP